MPPTEPTRGLMLEGPDGGNLLGFLAAVGTLRVATLADPSVEWRLRWEARGGTWAPLLLGEEALSQDRLLDLLMRAFTDMGNNPAFQFAKDLNIAPDEFRSVARSASGVATLQDRGYADFIAAFGCDGLTGHDKRTIQDTALRTMSGAGHQHFLGSMQTLAETTERDHLRTSLFEPWRYSDGRPSLRWDPADDRRYALRWRDPSDAKSPIMTMRGANRLAVEALPLFPTAPGERRLNTTGFSQRRGEGMFFTWPIWEGPLGADVVRSLLSLDELQVPQPDRVQLRARGVVEMYRSRRITTGKYRNFTAARPA